MAKIIKSINDINMLLDNNRTFFPSKNINIFPCSRRGQYEMKDSVKHYDPEARLNTERTNRLHAATNGFKDSFIERFDNYEYIDEENNPVKVSTLVFTLVGYRVEVKDFYPTDIAEALGIDTSTDDTSYIYAHLSLHDKVPLSIKDYYTEILYRQSTKTTNINYLDVTYTDSITEDFFVGVSFVSDQNVSDNTLPSHKLPLFSYNTDTDSWELVQTSLLPKIEHDTTEDSIKVSGDFTVVHPVLNEDGTPVLDTDGKQETQVSFKVTKDETVLGPTVMSSLIVGEKADDDEFLNGTIKVKEHIETPTLEATTKIDTPLLNVIGDDNSGQANIDKAIITTAEITSTLTVSDKASLLSSLDVKDNINVGNPTSPATDDTSGYIIAEKDITAEHDLIAKNNAKVENNLTVTNYTETNTLEAIESIKTQALDVKNIENNVDATGVTINDNLNVTTDHAVAADTINVNTINSRTDSSIAVESPFRVVGDTTLDKNLTVGADNDSNTGTIMAKNLVKTPTLNVNSITSDSDKVEINKPINVTGKATLANGLEVTAGDVTIESNFNVADNINVGTPTTPATADNGGYIVAEKDITAEQDLIAKRDIKAAKKATVESLVVGERTNADSTEAGVITAKNLVKTPTLNATTVDVDNITSDATDGLVVNPKTTIKNALDVEDTATLKNGLKVNSGNTVLKNLTVDNVTVTETNSISTPTLKVNTITSAATEVKVDKPLKVDSTLDVNNSKATLHKGLTVKDGLTVESGITTLQDTAATALQLTDIGQVPALEIANLKDTANYQLRFKFGSSTPIKTVNSFTEE